MDPQKAAQFERLGMAFSGGSRYNVTVNSLIWPIFGEIVSGHLTMWTDVRNVIDINILRSTK